MKDWDISYQVAHFARIEPVPREVSAGPTTMVGRLTRTRRSEHWSAMMAEKGVRRRRRKSRKSSVSDGERSRGELSALRAVDIFVYTVVNFIHFFRLLLSLFFLIL